MTVTLILPNEEEIKVKNSLFNTSELVTNLLIDTGKEDIRITISSTYASVINIYLEFLGKILINDEGEMGYPDDLPIINDRKVLFLCFLLESFFADNIFFQCLMRQSYKLWNEFLPDVYLLPDERLFYLYSPYEFVPQSYLNKETFFKEWLEINANKEVVLNGSEVYYTKVEYYPNTEKIKKLKVYHIINNKDIGYKIIITWYENGQLKFKDNYKDGEKDGLQEEWYENGQLEFKSNYKDGKLDGLWERWYDNGRPKYKGNYKDGELDGLLEGWFENGQLESKSNHKDGKEDGLEEEWYENGQLHYKENYKNGKYDGLYEEWYINGQLKYKRNYKDGKRDGLMEGWFENGQLESKSNYKDGKEDGLQEEWYEDGQLKHKSNYKYGERDGLCEKWYENGQLEYRQVYDMGRRIS